MALSCVVVTPDKTYFEGEAEHVVVPAWDGELAVYTKHAPLIARLGHGVLRVHPAAGGAPVRIAIYGGFLKVQDDDVTVLASGADESPAPEKASADLAAAHKKVLETRPPRGTPGDFEIALEQERRAKARVAAARSRG
ncbi:MAG TPA: ATP synthase F1 subunit epsilon [Planctomycetota bacterium]|nr:ATP synthase F1 subunit epsilon [Planctomycetota bacterium]